VELHEVYKAVRPTIVAFVPRYIAGPRPDVPPIIGTGFIVRDGLIATNDHVITALAKLPLPPGTPAQTFPFAALLFHDIPGQGVAQVPLDVLGVAKIGGIAVTGHYYGPASPDFGFVRVKMKGLSVLPVDSTAVVPEEGRRVATAGFPMGRDALRAPGYFHQMTPTLQEGVISAVLPFPGSLPHALMINVMSQGGASGSPVFAVDRPAAVGILYGGLEDAAQLASGEEYRQPTAFSYVVPAHFLENTLVQIDRDKAFQFPPDTPTLQDFVASVELVPAVKPHGGTVRRP
jgi:hypothetical protein